MSSDDGSLGATQIVRLIVDVDCVIGGMMGWPDKIVAATHVLEI